MENFEVKTGKINHENTNNKKTWKILTLDKTGKKNNNTLLFYEYKIWFAFHSWKVQLFLEFQQLQAYMHITTRNIQKIYLDPI